MKRKVLAFVALVAFAGIVAFSTNAAVPAVNPDCPNGCLANGDGCWCKAWYPCYKEAKWSNASLSME